MHFSGILSILSLAAAASAQSAVTGTAQAALSLQPALPPVILTLWTQSHTTLDMTTVAGP